MITDRAIERLLLTLWVGSLWTVGFIVAPALFAWFDNRAFVGSLTGQLLTLEAWLTIVLGLLLTALYSHRLRNRRDGRTPLIVTLIMIGLIAVGEWVIHPLVTASRVDPGIVFGILHTVSMLLYASAAVLGMLLVMRQR